MGSRSGRVLSCDGSGRLSRAERAEPGGRVGERLEWLHQPLDRPDQPLEPTEVGSVLAEASRSLARLGQAAVAGGPRELQRSGTPPGLASRAPARASSNSTNASGSERPGIRVVGMTSMSAAFAGSTAPSTVTKAA
jgi:hypothetical protein